MAILWVREDFKGRRARRDEQRTTYLREFLVLTDDMDDAALDVRLATGVPRVYDVHPDDLGARAREVEAGPEQDDANLWRVRVSYASNVLPATSEDPLDRPKELNWTYQPTTMILESAYDNQGGQTIPIENSAGMPFVPPVEVQTSLPTLQITRNELSFNVGLVTAYMDCANKFTWYTAPPGTALFTGATAQSIREGSTDYWRVTYNFQFKRTQWKLVTADAGMYGRSTNGKLYPIRVRDDNGNQTNTLITEPVFLDGAGNEQTVGLDPVYLTFFTYKWVDFAPLNLE